LFKAAAAAVIAGLFFADQATKWAIVLRFTEDDVVAVIPRIFHIIRAHNTGAAFSVGTGNNWLFIAFSFVVLSALAIMARRGIFADAWSRWGVVFLIPGILGNLFDRIWHGYVVDMISIDLGFWPAHPWPTFNVADSSIFVAAALFILGSFFEQKKEGANTSSS
jgi:signal peptidase II